ncbi:DNA cytosine methyltransferase, partial [Thalassolituus sp.]
MTDPHIVAIDLFCGAGGLTYGLRKAGIDVIAGIDIDPNSKYPYEFNNKAKFINRDINDVSSLEVEKLFMEKKGQYRLLAGCAPCQPFSGYSNGRDLSEDKKWPLMREFSRMIRDILPEFVTMENVPQVIKHSVYEDFVETLQSLGYQVEATRVKCIEFGIPQSRVRHVLLASRIGKVSLAHPGRKSLKTVREAIGSLPPISAGEQSTSDPLHVSSKLTDLNMARIKASRPG